MAFCQHCVQSNGPQDAFCQSCGAPLAGSQPTYQQTQSYNYNQYSYNQAPVNQVSIKDSVLGFIFSMLIGTFAYLSMIPTICFIFFPGVIVFFCLALRFKNNYERQAGKSNAFTVLAKVFAIIGLICGIVLFIVGFIFTIEYGGDIEDFFYYLY